MGPRLLHRENAHTLLTVARSRSSLQSGPVLKEGQGSFPAGWRIVLRRRSAYRFGFSVELRRRCTTDWDIRKVRAMAAGLTPALNDARMRFAVPSGILSIPLILLLRIVTDWPCDDAPVGAAGAVSFLGPPRLRRLISTVTAASSRSS